LTETKEQFEVAQKEIALYKPPSPHRIKTKRRILQVENWIAKNGLVQQDTVIEYIMKAFNLERPRALELFAEVKKDFERIGRVYGA
jgi:hypothetical protein